MDLSVYKINNASEALPLYEDAPDRFMRFYNAVYLLLCSIPENGTLKIADHCAPSSYDIFIKCACLCIMEERLYCNVKDALLEFDEEYLDIHRGRSFKNSALKPHFYSSRQR